MDLRALQTRFLETLAEGGAAKTQRTIGLISPSGQRFSNMVEQGGQAAATALGDHVDNTEASDAPTQISAIDSLIGQHAAAIAVDTDQGSGRR